jgi:hypothetical protein
MTDHIFRWISCPADYMLTDRDIEPGQVVTKRCSRMRFAPQAAVAAATYDAAAEMRESH